MKHFPKISIVIPSYNKADYIDKTLKSIAEQNYPNLEVIIQDPGSTDGSLKVINTYVKKYPRIFRLYKEKDSGQLDAINKGIKKATGDILTYINADDVYEPGALRSVGEYFIQNPKTLWLAGRGRVIDQNGNEISKGVTAYKNSLLNLKSYILLLVVNYLIQPSVFLSRFAWKKYGPFRGVTKFVMEYEMWLRIGKDEMPSVLNKDLSSFRIPEKSFSRDEFKKTLSEDMKIVRKFTKNPFILFLHKIHNLGRTLVIKTV
jgi:glycosyltransferase involved in cell wall biosynthesis